MKNHILIAVMSSALALGGCASMRTNIANAESGVSGRIGGPQMRTQLNDRMEVMNLLHDSVTTTVGEIPESSGVTRRDWRTANTNFEIFLAGTSYIDGRCSAYLNALNQYQKYMNRAQGFTAATGLATASILALANVAQETVGIVAAAFGLVGSGLEVTENTLLLGVAAPNLRRFVSQANTAYISQIRGRRGELGSRAEVERALQGYVELCTPVSLASMVEQALNSSDFTISAGAASIRDGNSTSDQFRSISNAATRADLLTILQAHRAAAEEQEIVTAATAETAVENATTATEVSDNIDAAIEAITDESDQQP